MHPPPCYLPQEGLAKANEATLRLLAHDDAGVGDAGTDATVV